MCNSCVNELEVKEYINHQTGEKLDLERVNNLKDNAMLKVKPELWEIWNFEKNDELGIDIFKVKKSSKKYTPWWICLKYDHPYEMDINCKVREQGCPYCSNHRLLVGFNDMWTTNPTQASWLLRPEDGHKYMRSAKAKLDWKCPNCGETVRDKIINNVNRNGLSCEKCTNDSSLPEKIVINLLKQLNVSYIYDRSLAWSNNKRYDFYIPSLNLIIETHGSQHYEERRGRFGKETPLKEVQANDKYKYELAIVNGIKSENYIVIDCSRSKFNYIKNNILNSKLSVLFDLSSVNWNSVFLESQKSIHLKMLEMCKQGFTKSQIIAETGYTYGGVQTIVKKFVDMGLCEKPIHIFNSKKIYQYTKTGDFIRLWDGTKEIFDELGYSRSQISECCTGKHKTARGFIWSYTKLHENY